ncbi:guanylate kinase [Thiospirillum jenense]|uniref:Guanylate kinase n=1 Tax=Thiospirillum jenense TaxID=1653858 RepID=A0A839HEP9_9GAMM|nr:guanylate kinase [Thiospirillum jenense]MBB1125866.1 guanylate kinase [Thiospirillum jenense]
MIILTADHTPTPPVLNATLFIISAPSGAGKTSLVRKLLARFPRLKLSTSYTTRAPRPGELNGEHYHFVNQETFERMITANEFVEYARVFNHAYGTAEATLRSALADGIDLILEIDWQGAQQVRARFPEAISVFILPPSLQALEQRLRSRAQDSNEVIAHRMTAARTELSHYHEYDYLIVNDQFETALTDLMCLIQTRRLRRDYQLAHHRAILNKLLAAPT